MNLDQAKFNELTSYISGLAVSEAYNSYGSSLCIEFGELTTDLSGRKWGEAYIRVDWDWRLEDDHSILCGSSNHGHKIAEMAESLVGMLVSSIDLFCTPPEVVIYFSNGLRLRSMAMVAGDPEWAIRLKDRNYISSKNGNIELTDGIDVAHELTPEECQYIEWANETAKRWGSPVFEPRKGRCCECMYYVRIDGNFSLLDFGVCSFSGGPFDGRVTNVNSGCPEFTES